jgi:micrococcal nuclease
MQDDYTRNARVLRVIDGDTVELSIDLGFDISQMRSCRLAGINAPEVHGATKEAGLASKAYLSELLRPGLDLVCQTIKTNDKYGRYLAKLYTNDANGATYCINDKLVAAGQAIYKDYE